MPATGNGNIWPAAVGSKEIYLITSANDVMFLLLCVCLSVCLQDHSKSCRRILMKFFDGVG